MSGNRKRGTTQHLAGVNVAAHCTARDRDGPGTGTTGTGPVREPEEQERNASRKRKSILVLPALAAVLTFGAGAAQASTAGIPHPNIVVGSATNTNGTAGWYTNSFGDTFTQVNGTFRLANFTYFLHSFPGYFNEAAAGTAYNTTKLSAPAINDLVDFSGVTATDSNGITEGLANWNAVQVSSGFPGYPPLLTTTAITPATGAVCTFHKGHWKWVGPRHHGRHIWVRGHFICKGGGPSSFSIVAGSPVGI